MGCSLRDIGMDGMRNGLGTGKGGASAYVEFSTHARVIQL